MALIFGCNDQERDEFAIPEASCKMLNDSAISAWVDKGDLKESVKLIDSAVACDPHSSLFARNKVMIFVEAGLYQESIDFVKQRERQFSILERLAIMADCYFHLEDSLMYDSLRSEVLSRSAQAFDSIKTESSLITYLTSLKRYDGEKKAIEMLDANRHLFEESEMYARVIDVLDDLPTLGVGDAAKK